MKHGWRKKFTTLHCSKKPNARCLILYPPRWPSYDVRLRVQPDHLGVRERGLLHRLLPLLLEGQQREEQWTDGSRFQAAVSIDDQRITGYSKLDTFLLNTLCRHNLKKSFYNEQKCWWGIISSRCTQIRVKIAIDSLKKKALYSTSKKLMNPNNKENQTKPNLKQVLCKLLIQN